MTSTQPPLTHADPLARRSLEVLQAGQAPSGAFVASPVFEVYRYAWLRDGAFCAHAFDLVGEREAAAQWHDWVTTSIEAHRLSIEGVVRRIAGGETPPPSAMPPARYTLDGALEPPEDDPWPNFQIDGYGMWLWSLQEHLAPAPLPERLARTVALVAAYLRETWRLKCFNCWEEFDGGVHASTLAAALRGLEAAGQLLDDNRWTAEAERIRVFMLDRLVDGARFKRGTDDGRLEHLGRKGEILANRDNRSFPPQPGVPRLVIVGAGRYRHDQVVVLILIHLGPFGLMDVPVLSDGPVGESIVKPDMVSGFPFPGDTDRIKPSDDFRKLPAYPAIRGKQRNISVVTKCGILFGAKRRPRYIRGCVPSGLKGCAISFIDAFEHEHRDIALEFLGLGFQSGPVRRTDYEGYLAVCAINRPVDGCGFIIITAFGLEPHTGNSRSFTGYERTIQNGYDAEIPFGLHQLLERE